MILARKPSFLVLGRELPFRTESDRAGASDAYHGLMAGVLDVTVHCKYGVNSFRIEVQLNILRGVFATTNASGI